VDGLVGGVLVVGAGVLHQLVLGQVQFETNVAHTDLSGHCADDEGCAPQLLDGRGPLPQVYSVSQTVAIVWFLALARVLWLNLLHLPDDVRIPVPLSGHRGHMLLGPDVVEDVALALPVDRTLAEHAPNLVHLW